MIVGATGLASAPLASWPKSFLSVVKNFSPELRSGSFRFPFQTGLYFAPLKIAGTCSAIAIFNNSNIQTQERYNHAFHRMRPNVLDSVCFMLWPQTFGRIGPRRIGVRKDQRQVGVIDTKGQYVVKPQFDDVTLLELKG